MAMPQVAWPPVSTVNSEYCQKLSGHRVWKDRKAVFDKLSAARAWDLLNTQIESETIPMASGDEADAALTAVSTLSPAVSDARLIDVPYSRCP